MNPHYLTAVQARHLAIRRGWRHHGKDMTLTAIFRKAATEAGEAHWLRANGSATTFLALPDGRFRQRTYTAGSEDAEALWAKFRALEA